ncbi:hypothetical protein BHE74_00041092, partial [Ensete ventricosum]
IAERTDAVVAKVIHKCSNLVLIRVQIRFYSTSWRLHICEEDKLSEQSQFEANPNKQITIGSSLYEESISPAAMDVEFVADDAGLRVIDGRLPLPIRHSLSQYLMHKEEADKITERLLL